VSYADIEIRILKQNANAYPVEITVVTETGQQEYSGGLLNPAGAPGVAAAGYADKQYGLDLFHWLFADTRLQTQWAAIGGAYKQRRIRLRIDAMAPELHQYPWEALCEPQHGNPALRLAAADATPFSRYMAGKWQPGKPIIGRPVRILVAIANPSNLGAQNPPMDAIVVQTEWNELNQSLQDIKNGSVELTLLPAPCTLQRLTDELRKGYHILHLICHGAAHAQAVAGVPGSSALYLADEDNLVARVKDSELAEQLALQLANAEVDDERKLRLVFLASCQTAKRSAYDAFRGVAPQLVATGVPAVLAMQDNVGVDAAREFAKAFYVRLLEHGQVDLATNQARQSLLAMSAQANQLQVAIPALFLRLRSGQLLGQRGRVSDQQAAGFWPFLLRNIDDGLCTIFLGPRLNTGLLSDGAAIAEALSQTFHYPMQDADNLARVAQFIALKDRRRLRLDYLLHLKRSIPGYLGEKLNNDQDRALAQKRTIGEVLEEYRWTERVRSVHENEPHFLLADLPIGLYMTTTVDNLMYTALAHTSSRVKAAAQAAPDAPRRKALEERLPRRVQPLWQQVDASPAKYVLTPDPDPDHRVVFHINGFDEDPDHLVLSEDDYLDHLVRLMRDQDTLLPSNIIGKLGKDSLVFIGFQLDDWEFRVILHGLLKRIAQTPGTRHVGVQLEAGPAANEVQARKYLEEYLGSYRIDIYWGTPQQFVGELHSRWTHYLETGNDNW